MKKYFVTGLLLTLSASMVACTINPPTAVTFTLSDLGTAVDFHTDAQKAFLEAGSNLDYIDEHKSELGYFSNSAPKGVKFSWTAKGDNGAKASSYTVTIKEEGNPDAITVTSKKSEVTVYNLKINQEYSWKVTANYKGISFDSEEATFTTSSLGPRNMKVDGVENVRDLGGYTLSNGDLYKQGLIYRCAELNGDKDGLSKPTKEGKRILLEDLGIKSEIDLRTTLSFAPKPEDEVCGITSSPLGDTVKYKSLPMIFGGTNIFDNNNNKDNIKAFFEYLADESNYPMVFHCVRGTDRTGALAFVIGAMCGVSKEVLMKDYLFSNFANINSSPIYEKNISGSGFYVRQINNYEGETYAEKTMSYLNEMVGVSKTTLEQIVNILVARTPK